MSVVFENRKVFTLAEVNKSIKKSLEERYSSSFWVMAEMNKLNHYTQSGHCFPELVEKQEGKVVALTNGLIWRTDFERINKRFLAVLDEPIRNGIKILFLATINYDPVHGLTLWIKDIDPSFSLGELEKEKQENIARLKEEGLFDKNKKIPIALLPQRIAVISVETSKGYSDFAKVLDNNPYGFQFFRFLFPAILQGERSVTSIIRQLKNIAKLQQHFDLVAIIRGGGGDVGLSSYNNYSLAKTIANFPLPVITGIGHSTNETVSEMISYKNAITPTELADWLMLKFQEFATPVENAALFIESYSRRLIDTKKNAFNAEIKLFKANVQRAILGHQFQIEKKAERVQLLARLVIKDQTNKLDNQLKMLRLMDPLNVLQRGYTLTKQNGNIVTSLEKIDPQEDVETVFVDGSLITKIK